MTSSCTFLRRIQKLEFLDLHESPTLLLPINNSHQENPILQNAVVSAETLLDLGKIVQYTHTYHTSRKGGVNSELKAIHRLSPYI